MAPGQVGRPTRKLSTPKKGSKKKVGGTSSASQKRYVEALLLKQNPPVFNGLGDPVVAETWVRALERIFDFLGCTVSERLKCVAFQLAGAADIWWETIKKTMTTEQLEQMTSDEFKEIIYDKYIPESYKKAKEVEFFNLKQGRMSVTEYGRMFCEMARYTPDQVGTNEKLAVKFRAGLRLEIGLVLVSLGGLSYADSLCRALAMETVLAKEKPPAPAVTTPPTLHPQKAREKLKWEGDQNSYGNRRPQYAPNPPQNFNRQFANNQRANIR